MAGTIDAHFHYWQVARGDYDWLDPDDPALAPINRDFGPADLAPLADAAGVSRRILVQAAPTVAETRFLLEQARKDPKVAGVVGWVDLSARDAPAEIAALAADPLLKGVRPMLQDLDDPDWIATRPRGDAVEALKAHGLRFDALVKPPQLAGLLRFAIANPDLPIIIDHAAKLPVGSGRDDEERRMWEDGMAALAGLPHLCCKLSGLLSETPAELRATPAQAAGTLAPVLERLIGWFGPQRLAWGSDWPVLTLAADYGFWVETTRLLLAGLPEADRAGIMAGTAARFYGLDEAPG